MVNQKASCGWPDCDVKQAGYGILLDPWQPIGTRWRQCKRKNAHYGPWCAQHATESAGRLNREEEALGQEFNPEDLMELLGGRRLPVKYRPLSSL